MSILIIDVAHHIFDITKREAHGVGSYGRRERISARLCAFRDHVAVVDQMQIHGIVRGGGVARLDGVGHAAVRADGLLDELLPVTPIKRGTDALSTPIRRGTTRLPPSQGGYME